MLKEGFINCIYYMLIGTLICLIILVICIKNKELKEFSYMNASYLEFCFQKSKYELSKLVDNKKGQEDFVFVPKNVNKIKYSSESRDANKETNIVKSTENYIKTTYDDILNSYIKNVSGYTVDEMVDAIGNIPK